MSRRAFLGSLGTLLALGPRAALGQSATAEAVVTSLAVFAGTRSRLLRSRDFGASWEPIEVRLPGGLLGPSGGVRCLLPVGPRVWAGGERGLLISDDFGATWSVGAVEASVLAVLAARYPLAEPTLFVGTEDGLLKSEDLGRSFRPTSLVGTPVHRIAWPGPALVVATGRGVLVSVDAGTSFSGPGANLPAGEASSLALSSFYPVDPVMFAGIGAQGVHRSSDGGKTWAAAGLEERRVSDLYWLGPFLYAATDAGLFRSEDLGRRWVPLKEGLAATPRRLLFPLAPDSGAVVFAATDSGVFRSGDGGNRWQPSGLAGEEVLVLGTFPAPERSPGGKKRRGPA